ncbi:tetratricopeptide repeat protein [Burkholderia territorii]|uniref:Tetratricopeptide repeat protein n=1 Tax=Burkholderia territorii TaxID=1503055 RepID=A0A6L3NPA4_9BURK|nr:tetratricopeptide repeat protein [Burkholderia territorii]KAB0686341.1 tetratricopeptide repeat protein [Burkholderia territorii]MBM2775957.1 tetratricopeptide repeat protein [Burkholderia territorii]VWB48713.1 TPR domain-containing protein [Burkholderia territorii]
MTTHEPLSALIDRLLDQGDLIGASRLFNEVAATNVSDPPLLIAGSRVMRMRGREADADALIERALVLDPDYAPAWVERARQAAASEDWAQASRWYARAYQSGVEGEPWILEWIELLARHLDQTNAVDLAERFCEAAPHSASGWFHLGLLHQRARRHREALAAYARAEQLDPAMPMLQNNIAAAHIELGDFLHAQPLLEALVAREPSNALAWNNLSLALLEQHDLAGSEVASERACALAPDYPVALLTHVQVLKERQQWSAALDAIHRAHQFDPNNPSIIWAMAMLQLLQGDYVQGWANHEARWLGSPELRDVSPDLPVPRWTGESLNGKTLFVWGEQGNGDAIQFMRFVPQLAERVHAEGGKLVYCCFAQFLSLFSRTLEGIVDAIVPHDVSVLPVFDFELPLASLPRALGVTMDRLPGATHYLKPDPGALERGRCRGANDGRLRVGLVWSGNRIHRRNPLRSIEPLAYANAFKDIDEIEFVNLQLDASDELRAMREAGMAITDPTVELHSYDDTAALLSTLDLVITVCTSVAHLAGALGVQTWLLLDVNPHWVWMTERADSPWYPSLTLYRQTEYRKWAPVIERVANDLRHLSEFRRGESRLRDARSSADESTMEPKTSAARWLLYGVRHLFS